MKALEDLPSWVVIPTLEHQHHLVAVWNFVLLAAWRTAVLPTPPVGEKSEFGSFFNLLKIQDLVSSFIYEFMNIDEFVLSWRGHGFFWLPVCHNNLHLTVIMNFKKLQVFIDFSFIWFSNLTSVESNLNSSLFTRVLMKTLTDNTNKYSSIHFFIFVVTPCMLLNYSIIIPTTAHI